MPQAVHVAQAGRLALPIVCVALLDIALVRPDQRSRAGRSLWTGAAETTALHEDGRLVLLNASRDAHTGASPTRAASARTVGLAAAA